MLERDFRGGLPAIDDGGIEQGSARDHARYTQLDQEVDALLFGDVRPDPHRDAHGEVIEGLIPVAGLQELRAGKERNVLAIEELRLDVVAGEDLRFAPDPDIRDAAQQADQVIDIHVKGERVRVLVHVLELIAEQAAQGVLRNEGLARGEQGRVGREPETQAHRIIQGDLSDDRLDEHLIAGLVQLGDELVHRLGVLLRDGDQQQVALDVRHDAELAHKIAGLPDVDLRVGRFLPPECHDRLRLILPLLLGRPDLGLPCLTIRRSVVRESLEPLEPAATQNGRRGARGI